MIHVTRPALSAEAMRQADRLTLEEYGIPGFTLMETAGRAAVDAIEKKWGATTNRTAGILCGKGNNGGDGLVAARVLYQRGATVHVLTLAESGSMTPDSATNFKLLEELARNDDASRLFLYDLHHLEEFKSRTGLDLVIDALLGTGVRRELSSPYDGLVQWINAIDVHVAAMDIPTGLHADTGAVLGHCVRAGLTVTMGALKTGLLIGEGPEYAGQIETVEIGIPDHILSRVSEMENCARVVMAPGIRSWLPVRRHDAHKYGVGMALVVAGSEGLTGAATLASTAAARSGAGAVICATSERVQPILAQKMTEIMTLPLPANDEGIQSEDVEHILQPALDKASALLVGCGMGRRPDTQAFIRNLLARIDLPCVVDADGLNALAGFTEMLPEYASRRWILTPHLGEFKRLAGEEVDVVNRIATARRFALAWNCVLILKGAPSIVADPEGRVYINPTGNSALATAGTGDVLAGLCVGFLAQGLLPVQAALTALYIGGRAADIYAERNNPISMLAGDLIIHFIEAITELYG